MKTLKYLFIALCATMMVSCVSVPLKEQTYVKMYSEKPLVIAVMPPINKTNNVEAKEFLYWTLAKPLCERGYYVVSPYLSMDMFKSESAYDAEQFINGSLKRFQDILGADAVLFTTIKKWEKAALVSNIYVEIEYVLKSTKTNEIIFERTGDITYDASVNASGGGLLGALVNVAASALSTALTDHIKVARACNDYTLVDMPSGVYSPTYDKDQKTGAGKKVFKATIR
ncbi:MAG: DUF799 family lipoprotein [Dysgonamonadaceae bacterium]|jgi:hypothetical protein|nr:DUF799 family lipoprotein [Dysgonamonadaceae bacterium]